jgi:F420-dependent oxidoreductase-like protein
VASHGESCPAGDRAPDIQTSRARTIVKLGYSTLTWTSRPPADAAVGVIEADRLGLDSVWTSEAYGADAFTPLAWWGAATRSVRLGTAIAQISARPPTAAAMAALALDHLSGGRFMLGLGASGPQVVEGWYGQPFTGPLERTREYFAVLRQALRREQPVRFHGRHYTLPFEGGTGLGRPLKPVVHPYRPQLPVLLAATGPRNIALAAEIADGWLPMWFSPKLNAWAADQLTKGFAARAGAGRPAGFEVVAQTYLGVADSVEAAADTIRPMLALYIGGMGAPGANFHADVFARMGWQHVCEGIQAMYLNGDKQKAAAAVPTELVEDIALVGPLPKILDDLERWRSTVVTTLAIKCRPEILAQIRDHFE